MLVFSRFFQSIVLVALLGSQSAAAFQSASKARTATSLNAEAVERRDFLSQAAVTTAASLLAAGGFAVPRPALASGGATAGGAYLLSAKQRYNDRVTKGLKGFLALEESLKAGSVKEATAYFAGVEVGTFGDISTAGYLLANAFRQSANKAPDALPSVKVSRTRHICVFICCFGVHFLSVYLSVIENNLMCGILPV